eukprot:scaffold159632_cov26-Tisochrysis_lutea.AAC.2
MIGRPSGPVGRTSMPLGRISRTSNTLSTGSKDGQIGRGVASLQGSCDVLHGDSGIKAHETSNEARERGVWRSSPHDMAAHHTTPACTSLHIEIRGFCTAQLSSAHAAP